jgi:hypothetical protein
MSKLESEASRDRGGKGSVLHNAMVSRRGVTTDSVRMLTAS